jgi:hypothetical protein
MVDGPSKRPGPVEPDPYAAGLVSKQLRIIKNPVPAHAIGILTNTSQGRRMALIASASRAVRMHDIHELVCTEEAPAPGEVVNDVGYLAFIAIEESAVLAVGDLVQVDGALFGKIVGFNEVHAPNHINIIVQVPALCSGFEAGWHPGTRILFVTSSVGSPDAQSDSVG